MSASPVSVPAGPGYAPRTLRASNGLKQFLWHLDGVGRGQLLDVGPVWQHTVGFFIERGFRVYSEDLMGELQAFLEAEEAKVRALGPGEGDEDMTPAGRATRFLKTSLQQEPGTLDGILLWDLLDYLDGPLGARVVARITSLVRDGGVVLALFHSRKPEGFHRYRVHDAENLELVGANCSRSPQRVYRTARFRIYSAASVRPRLSWAAIRFAKGFSSSRFVSPRAHPYGNLATISIHNKFRTPGGIEPQHFNPPGAAI